MCIVENNRVDHDLNHMKISILVNLIVDESTKVSLIVPLL